MVPRGAKSRDAAVAAGMLGSRVGLEGTRAGQAKREPKKGCLLQWAFLGCSHKLLQFNRPRRHLMCECESCPDPSASVSLAPVSPDKKWLCSYIKAAPTTAFSWFHSEKAPAEERRRNLEILPLPLLCFGIPENKKAAEEWQAL